MHRLSHPQKSISERVREAQLNHRRNHIAEVAALSACGFVGAAIIVFFIAKIIAIAGDKFNF